jgi:hypothetical protein
LSTALRNQAAGLLRVAQPAPPQVQLHEGVLHHLLAGPPVVQQQPCQPHQGAVLLTVQGRDEVVGVRRRRHVRSGHRRHHHPY